MKYICLAVAWAVALAAGTAGAATDFRQGNIEKNTTWTLDKHPYYIQGDVHILNGATLTIEAGVEVRFYEVQGTGGYEDGAELVVKNGSLVTNGKSGMPVTFTSANRVKKVGDWGAIVVYGSNQVILENAVIEYATNGLRFDRTTSSGASRSSFAGTRIRNCLKCGVYAYNAAVNLYHVSVERNVDSGVKTSGNNCRVTASYCDINNNYGMYNFYNDSANNVEATSCWWGTTVPNLIEMRIYDKKDNPTRGAVDYTPYLTRPWREGGGVTNYSTGFLKSLFK
ncbi:MAG: hypothetical protein JSU81_05505 [Candidatus Coatesbacteria bacterium]|nr:MAG: hypothetical protein JSU81_05505 [Candidatus Coatesbacteria bacterium]